MEINSNPKHQCTALVVRSEWRYALSRARYALELTRLKARLEGRESSIVPLAQGRDVHNYHGRDRRERSLRNERAQAEAMRPLMKRVAFRKCGRCGESTLYESYENPTYAKGTQVVVIDWDRWCYACGARDEETYNDGDDLDARHERVTLRTLESLLAKAYKLGFVKGEQK